MGYRRLASSITGMAFAFVGLVALQACDGSGKNGPSGVLSISSLSPATGLTDHATAVTIHGHGFKTGATVSFGNVTAGVNSLSEDTIATTVFMHDPATVDVVVTNPDGGSVTKSGAFAFMFVAPPSISAVSPSIGSTGGGALVSVNGSNFRPGLTATLDGVPLTVSLNTVNGISFSFIAPAHPAGVADIVARNSDGQDSTGHAFASHYSWASPDTFDFTGEWAAFLGDGNDAPFTFSVDENNTLVNVTCYEGTPMPLPGTVKVSDGQISVSSNGSVLFSARIVANGQTVGTINFGLCHSSNWTGRR